MVSVWWLLPFPCKYYTRYQLNQSKNAIVYHHMLSAYTISHYNKLLLLLPVAIHTHIKRVWNLCFFILFYSFRGDLLRVYNFIHVQRMIRFTVKRSHIKSNNFFFFLINADELRRRYGIYIVQFGFMEFHFKFFSFLISQVFNFDVVIRCFEYRLDSKLFLKNVLILLMGSLKLITTFQRDSPSHIAMGVPLFYLSTLLYLQPDS